MPYVNVTIAKVGGSPGADGRSESQNHQGSDAGFGRRPRKGPGDGSRRDRRGRYGQPGQGRGKPYRKVGEGPSRRRPGVISLPAARHCNPGWLFKTKGTLGT